MTHSPRHHAFEAALAPVDVAEARPADIDAWRAFAAARPEATIFHDPAWGEVAERAYGHQPLRLIARRGTAVVGILPLTDVRGALFGRNLISTAFTVGGGVLAVDEATRDALCATAEAAANARGAGYVELRSDAAAAGWIAKDGVYAGYARPLASDPEAELGAVPRKRRAEVRKGLAAASEGRMSITHEASAADFHALYARSLRDLGTPTPPLRFVAELANALGDRAFFTIVSVDGVPAFSVMSFLHRGVVMPYYAGVTPLARAAKAADFGYFEIMNEARRRGMAAFDFGRSKVGSPHAYYKKSWGFEPTPITYRYFLARARQTPNVNPSNPKFRLLTNAWRRIPLPLANVIGPLVARELA
ncbi:MAG: FemAB family PEP-CTERM system-associated protein [Alphaproteobacteria bacterium]|nr:FemAB family PEP-CTERM system-associated protein [Alphaproteobacteria bacterium]